MGLMWGEEGLSQPAALPAWGLRGSGGIPSTQPPLREQSLWLTPGLHTDFQGSGETQGLPHFRLMAVLTISGIKVLTVQP